MTEPSDEYSITVSNAGPVTVSALNGRASASNSAAISVRVIDLVQELKPERLLIDCRDLEGRLDTAGTYYHVKAYPRVDHHPAKTVVLERPEHFEYFSFHETVAANRGYPFRTMTGFDEAIRWLCR